MEFTSGQVITIVGGVMTVMAAAIAALFNALLKSHDQKIDIQKEALTTAAAAINASTQSLRELRQLIAERLK